MGEYNQPTTRRAQDNDNHGDNHEEEEISRRQTSRDIKKQWMDGKRGVGMNESEGLT